MTCEHTIADMDTAAHWDGKCPLCMEAEIAKLHAKLANQCGGMRAEHGQQVLALQAEIERLREANISLEARLRCTEGWGKSLNAALAKIARAALEGK